MKKSIFGDKYYYQNNLMFAPRIILMILTVLLLGLISKNVSAQESQSVLYVPLIGITAIPNPLVLPNGPANVTYNYAVKNFLKEVPLQDIQVVDDKCAAIKFIEGDDNHNSRLDYDETWRYRCSVKLAATTQSMATVTGHSNNVSASHKAYATVVVGDKNPAPLVSIINITKVAYPLSLPADGGKITFTYKVNNPGDVPLTEVNVTDDKCKDISSRLGDTNGNNSLDTNEVWIYNCSTTLTETTTNTVHVSAFANNLKAVDNATITVKVATPASLAQIVPGLPNAGDGMNLKIIIWEIMLGIIAILTLILVIKGKNKSNLIKNRIKK